MTTPTSALAPPGWRFERVNARAMRITDPMAPGPLIVSMDDQALAMRVLYRLVSEFPSTAPATI